MTDAPMPADIAAAPVGEAMRFVTEQLRCNGSAPLEAFLARFTSDYAAFIKEQMATVAAVSGPFTVVAYRLPKANLCVAELQGDDGRGWALGVGIVDGVTLFSPAHLFPRPAGLSYRPVAPTDADALAALELAAPIVTGDVETTYDKSRDYFEAERLMGSYAFVVERDGAIVGLFASVVHPIRIAGTIGQGVYDHRVRVHPDARRGGVMGVGALARFEAIIGRTDLLAGYSFVAADNDAALRLRWLGPSWPAVAERLVIDTGSAAAPGLGRPATPADADQLVSLLNDTHGEEELFCPYSQDSLRERLSRAPNSYSWSSFLLSERACVGVWAPKMGVTRRAGGVEQRDVRAFVLDYGCTSDGLDEFVALVNDWRARLAAEGTTELSIFTSPGSRGTAALTALAKRRDPYVVVCAAPPGDRVNERGIYVDQLYF